MATSHTSILPGPVAGGEQKGGGGTGQGTGQRRGGRDVPLLTFLLAPNSFLSQLFAVCPSVTAASQILPLHPDCQPNALGEAILFI